MLCWTARPETRKLPPQKDHQEASAVQGDAAFGLAKACSGRQSEHSNPSSLIRSRPSGCGSNNVSTELVSNIWHTQSQADLLQQHPGSPSSWTQAPVTVPQQQRMHGHSGAARGSRQMCSLIKRTDYTLRRLSLKNQHAQSSPFRSPWKAQPICPVMAQRALTLKLIPRQKLVMQAAAAALSSTKHMLCWAALPSAFAHHQQPGHRMKALRPLPMQPAPATLLSKRMRASLGSQAYSSSILTGEDSRGAARAEDPGADSQSRHTNGGLSSHRQNEAAGPAYMNSTASVRAKADSAEQQLKACRAARHAVRRWSY